MQKIHNIFVSLLANIREKIEIDPSIPVRIITEAGIGYRMEISDIVPLHEQGTLSLSV